MEKLVGILYLVYLLTFLVRGNSINFNFQVSFSLTNISTTSVDVAGKNALCIAIKEALEVSNVDFISQEPSENGIMASVKVYVNNKNNFKDLTDLTYEYDNLRSYLNQTSSNADITYLLRQYAKLYHSKGMSNIQAESKTPQQLNFDSRHDDYTWRTGGVVGIVLGVFFFCLCCIVSSIIFIRHKGDNTEPQALQASEWTENEDRI